ncbi:MAG: hypothetical protein SFU86_05205 [Pirellulaceae bacterium]|nr:hypothetical protein [Pirellulaceae bacterium]
MAGVSVRCPRCGNVNLVPAAAVPAPVRCPQCGGGYLAPASVVPPPPPPPLPSELPKSSARPAFVPRAEPPPSEPPPIPAEPTRGSRLVAALVGIALLLLLGVGAVGIAAGIVWFNHRSRAADPLAAEPAPTPSERPGEEIKWADATKPLVRDGVSVKVRRVEYGEVLARDEKNNPVPAGTGDFFTVYLDIENAGNGDLSYASWQGGRFEVNGELVAARLSDEQEATYEPHKFEGFRRIKGHLEQATLSRGSVASDVLIFAVPRQTVDGANSFWLELPASAFARATSDGPRECRGYFRLEIGADLLNQL